MEKNSSTYRIYYLTGWKNPYIHHNASQKGEWKTQPLISDPSKINLFYFDTQVNVPIEFVFCDESRKSWDNNSGKNYKIKEHGADCFVFKNTIVPISKEKSQNSFVFSIDLDCTLLGDGLALKEFEIHWLKYCYFDKTKLLIYNTGRSFKSAMSILGENLAMLPDVFITSCGTEIFVYNPLSKNYEIEPKWKEIQLSRFPTAEIEQSLKKYSYWLKNINCNDYRISFTAKTEDIDKNYRDLMKIKEIYSDKTLDVIVSGHGEYRYIDILSSEGGKGKALKHLISVFKIEKSVSYAFGDSTNDLEMLEMADFGVIVSNFQEDLGKKIAEKKIDHIEFSQYNNANAILNKLKSLISNILK